MFDKATKGSKMYELISFFYYFFLPFPGAFLKLNFMAPFYGWGSIASRLQPLPGGSLLFTIQFPEISGTHFINLGRMKG